MFTTKHTHTKVFGKEALELFAEARYLGNACCEARYAYLKKMATKYVAWVGKKEWCEDNIEYAKGVVARIEKILDPDPQGEVSDGQIDTTLIGADISRMQLVDELDDEYQLLMEKIVSKSMRDPAAKVIWWQQRVFSLEQQLKLHDEIQDLLDGLLVTKFRGYYKDVFGYLFSLYEVRRLNWDGYVSFWNQLVNKLGHRSQEDKAYMYLQNRYEPRDTADRLVYYTRRLEEEKAKVAAESMEFGEKSLDQLDNDLIPVENLVYHV